MLLFGKLKVNGIFVLFREDRNLFITFSHKMGFAIKSHFEKKTNVM